MSYIVERISFYDSPDDAADVRLQNYLNSLEGTLVSVTQTSTMVPRYSDAPVGITYLIVWRARDVRVRYNKRLP